MSVTLTAEPRDYHRRLPPTVCRGRDDSAVCREFLRTDRSRSLDEHTGHGEGCRAKVRRYGHAIRSPRFGNYTYRAGSDENEAIPEQENRAAAQHQARLARSACGCCAQGPVVPGAGIALRHAGSSCGRAMVAGRGWQTLGESLRTEFWLALEHARCIPVRNRSGPPQRRGKTAASLLRPAWGASTPICVGMTNDMPLRGAWEDSESTHAIL